MLKQKTVPTSLGELTVSTLTLGDCRSLPDLFVVPEGESTPQRIDRLLPSILASVRKTHQDMTIKMLHEGITLADFNALLMAILEVSGMSVRSGEEQVMEPVPV